MDTKDYYVYMYLRSHDSEHGIKGSPYYIGKGRKQRVFGKHRVRVPKNKMDIIFVQTNLTNNEAILLEIDLIKHYGRINTKTGCLANLTDGGEGTSGWICSEETKAKISKSNKGKVRTDDLIKEHSKRMSGSLNPFFGKKHSEAVRKEMSNRQKGKSKTPFTEEHKRNIAKSRIGIVPWNKAKVGVQDYSNRKKETN